MVDEFLECIKQRGSFHEDEVVALTRHADQIRLKILQKSCADREQDRQVLWQAELVLDDVVLCEASSQDERLDATTLFDHRSVDLSIIHLAAALCDGIPEVTMHFDGFIDDSHFDSAKLVVRADCGRLLVP